MNRIEWGALRSSISLSDLSCMSWAVVVVAPAPTDRHTTTTTTTAPFFAQSQTRKANQTTDRPTPSIRLVCLSLSKDRSPVFGGSCLLSSFPLLPFLVPPPIAPRRRVPQKAPKFFFGWVVPFVPLAFPAAPRSLVLLSSIHPSTHPKQKSTKSRGRPQSFVVCMLCGRLSLSRSFSFIIVVNDNHRGRELCRNVDSRSTVYTI